MLKKIYLIVIGLNVAAPRMSAQIKGADPIVIDFSNLKDEYKCYVDFKKSKEIKITNINRKVYSIDEANAETDFNTTVPSAIGGIKLPAFLFMGKLPKPNAPLPPSGQLPVELKFTNEDTKPEEAILAYFAEIQRRSVKLNDAVLLFNDINNLSKDCSKNQEQIKKELRNLTNRYLHNQLTNPIPDASFLYNELKDSLPEMRKGAEQLLEHLTDNIPKYISAYKKELSDAISIAETQIPEEKKTLKDKKATKEQKDSATLNITRYEVRKKLSEKKLEHFEDQAKEISDNLDKAAETVASMYTFEKDDNIHSILNAYSLLNSPNSFTYTANFTKAKKDKTTYTFTITPKDLNECTQVDKKVIEVELLTKGGLKIDFSTGAFVNFGSEDFLGRSFYYKNLTDSTRQIISAEREHRLMLSVGALMHFYKRSPTCVKIGGSLGVSTTADLSTLNFHVGPSLIFGNESRIILTGGLTLKTSSVLDRQLEMNKTYSKLESPDDIPLVNIFPKAGAFISITYNVSRFAKGPE